MEQLKVRIKGIAPLLMNRYQQQETDAAEKGLKRKDKKYSAEEDAKKASYVDEKLGYFAPSEWIEACLRETAKDFKGKGKTSLKNTVLAAVFVDEQKIPFGKPFDEIDIRPVVIQRNRVPKGRPKFNTWELSFILNFDESRLQRETMIELLKEAGKTRGIGDYRPKFGRFEVVEAV